MMMKSIPGQNHEVVSDVKGVSGSLEPIRSVQVSKTRRSLALDIGHQLL
jgi:hypothetical protein